MGMLACLLPLLSLLVGPGVPRTSIQTPNSLKRCREASWDQEAELGIIESLGVPTARVVIILGNVLGWIRRGNS